MFFKVHLVGGVIGLIATVYLKPRRNRFNEDSVHQMSSPTNALLGQWLFVYLFIYFITYLFIASFFIYSFLLFMRPSWLLASLFTYPFSYLF